MNQDFTTTDVLTELTSTEVEPHFESCAAPDRRAKDRLEYELEMSIRFEAAWHEHHANSSFLSRYTHQDLVSKGVMAVFKAGWCAAYDDVHSRMRRDNTGTAQ